MTGPYPPPPPGEPVRWRSSHLLPCVPADKRKKKREKEERRKIEIEKKDWPLRPPCLILAGTSRRPWPPRSPSPPYHLSPWRTAPIPVPAGTGPLSSPLPSPPLSRAPAAGVSTGCSVGGDAPVFGPLFPRTTSTCGPLVV
jgi:hypothetical protein